MDQAAPLRRRLSLPLLVLYGVGTTIGAGIYVLIGKIAGTAGAGAPFAFALSGLLVAASAFCFAELGARFPKAAGEAVYVHRGFGSPNLALVVGLMVVSAGIVSSATITLGFAGYLRQVLDLTDPVIVLAIVVLLATIAAWGIGESVTIAAVVTVLEVAGLAVIIAAGIPTIPEKAGAAFADFDALAIGTWAGVLSGAILAFYAFIGFEDMVNVAEEVQSPERVLPRAIVATLIVTVALYLLVAIVAVTAVPIADLTAHEAPAALLYERTTGWSPTPIIAIALISVLNGALIQVIMSARVLYGLAREGWLPAPLAHVHPRTQTPIIATAVVAIVIAVLALTLPLVGLARITSYITLVVFALVALALWRIKGRADHQPAPFSIPRPLCLVAAIVNIGVLVFEFVRIANV